MPLPCLECFQILGAYPNITARQPYMPKLTGLDPAVHRIDVHGIVFSYARMRQAQAVLNTDPTNIDALQDIGRLALGPSVEYQLRRHGVERLTDLDGMWSRAEQR